MKIIIEHSVTKREIKGSFNICGSAEDLHSLMRQLKSRLESDVQFNYGWINIYESAQVSIADTPPIPWDTQ